MVWTVVPEVCECDKRLKRIAPMGYSLVIHVRSMVPEFYFSTFPAEWVERYAERQYALFDPVNIWARTNTGRVRWSEIDLGQYTKASSYIMELAREHGLVYGGGVSRNRLEDDGTFSFLFCSRNDRELTDAELDEIETLFDRLIVGFEASKVLSETDIVILAELAGGLSHKEIALRHRVSPETVKKRLFRVRDLLGARNTVQAVAIAVRRGLILNYPAGGQHAPC